MKLTTSSGLIFVFTAIVASCIASYGHGCDVSAPEITLSEVHSGCHTNGRSHHPNCLAAMHRFCGRVSYPSAIHTLGISREHINRRIHLSCVKSHWKGLVQIGDLSSVHSGCNIHKTQHRDCLSASHRFCTNRFGGDKAGIIQEVRQGIVELHCFTTTRKETVRHDVLRNLNPGCQFPNSDSDSCFSAASRWCNRYFGYSGGMTLEVNSSLIVVGCYNAEFSGIAFNVRSNDFYNAINHVDHMCSLNFNVEEGEILHSAKEVLKIQVFDNHRSSVPLRQSTLLSHIPLQPSFEYSKQVIERSRFEHSHGLIFSQDFTYNSGIPHVLEGDIVFSSLSMMILYMSKENSRNVLYKGSSVIVSPITKVKISAIITNSALDVPWNASVVTGLGTVKNIRGQWKGFSTHNLTILQQEVTV